MKFQRFIEEQGSGFSDLCAGTVLVVGLVTLLWWVSGTGWFYTDSGPVLSPFTSLSLVLITGGRLAHKHLTRWPMPLTLAWNGIVIGGNLSNIMVQMSLPGIFLDSFPGLVPTSIMTSTGLILYCTVEILVIIRDTRHNTFIWDDILLYLALLPGGISFLGHLLGQQTYLSSPVDPRAGIGLLETVLMAGLAAAAALSNRHLFLWRFLDSAPMAKVIFLALAANLLLAPLAVGWWLQTTGKPLGIELFVMGAGVFATLVFLVVAEGKSRQKKVP